MSSLFAQQQQKNNEDTRDNWRVAQGHRQSVAGLLRHWAPEPRGRLTVLGAGNLNDVDLHQLAESFERIDLVDLDREALRLGLERQGAPPSVTVQSHAPVDVTAVYDQLQAVQADPSPSAIDALVAAAVDPPAILAEPCEVVASTCLVSQLFDTAVRALGPDHARLPEVVVALREGHLRLMAKTLKPGGVGALVTDFVSSDTAPELIACPPYALQKRLRSLIQEGNFFVGLNPLQVQQVITELAPELRIVPESIASHTPWKWGFGARVFAVTAYTFRKRADG